MTNNEIILRALVAAEIITKEQAMEHLANLTMPRYHTFAEWKNRGFTVKRGEHAALCVDLWKPYKSKADKEADKEMEEQGKPGNSVSMRLTKAYLFSFEQVEKATTPRTVEQIKAYNAMLKAQRETA